MNKILMAAVIFLSPIAIAQSFNELKNKIGIEQDNLKKLSLLQEMNNELTNYSLTEQAEYGLLLGNSLVKQNKMKEGLSKYTDAINLYNTHKLSPSSELVNLLIARSRALSNIDHSNTAYCKDREEALIFSRKLEQPNLIAKSIAYYAKCLQSKEYGISKSLKLFDEAFTIAKEQQLSQTSKQIIFNQAASLSFRALIYDKAYEYNKLALQSFTETNDINSIYNSTLNAIHYSIAMVDVDIASQHLAELEKFSDIHPEFKDDKLKFYYLSAKVAQLQQNWPSSILYLEAGLNEIKNSQNTSYIQATYELLSISYFRIGDLDKSFQTMSAVKTMYPDKKPIKKEILLIQGVMAEKPIEIAKSALQLIDKEIQSKNNFVKQSTLQTAQLFDDNLKQLDNIILEQRLTIVIFSTFFIVAILIGFSYLQIQRKKLALKEHHLMDELLNKKNQLLADVSHELSTPLTVLKLQVESLKDNLEDDVNATYDALDNKITDIEHLIDDIHQLAQSDVGDLNLNIDTFELNNTLDYWQEELTQIINKNKLDFEISRELPESLLVNFDRDRIKQIFINLLTNSVKYTDKPGKIKLTATSKNKTLLLSIEDSAPGVSKEDLINIFERLYRVENSRSRETGGSGLGLAICKSLIEAHHGRIYAEHSMLGGLKVIIELPLKTEN
jgi:two-component system, OmpR family, sensor histidine kinase BaeS